MQNRYFINQVAKKTRIPRALVQKVFTALIQEGTEILLVGDEWRLPAFGVFQAKWVYGGYRVKFRSYASFHEAFRRKFVEATQGERTSRGPG